jgi:hypothetical protein
MLARIQRQIASTREKPGASPPNSRHARLKTSSDWQYLLPRRQTNASTGKVVIGTSAACVSASIGVTSTTAR